MLPLQDHTTLDDSQGSVSANLTGPVINVLFASLLLVGEAAGSYEPFVLLLVYRAPHSAAGHQCTLGRFWDGLDIIS